MIQQATTSGQTSRIDNKFCCCFGDINECSCCFLKTSLGFLAIAASFGTVIQTKQKSPASPSHVPLVSES
jgi:hypothetical protein